MRTLTELKKIYNEKKRSLGWDTPPRGISKFTIDDLIGEEVSGIRIAKRGKHKGELRVVDFESGNTLIIGEEGWHEGHTNHYYLITKRSIKYTNNLYDIKGYIEESRT